MITRILTNPHKNKSLGARTGEQGGHALGAALPTSETGVEILAHFSMVMRGYAVLLEVHASFLVIFV
jgi:hypothetical protein